MAALNGRLTRLDAFATRWSLKLLGGAWPVYDAGTMGLYVEEAVGPRCGLALGTLDGALVVGATVVGAAVVGAVGCFVGAADGLIELGA